MINKKEKKFYNYIKEGKNREEKNNVNTPSEEYNSQKKENKIYYKRKINKLYINEVYKKGTNEYSEYEKKEKNNNILRLRKNNLHTKKCKFYENIDDDFIENKNIIDNSKIQRKEKKYNFKLNRIFIVYIYNINLKTIGKKI